MTRNFYWIAINSIAIILAANLIAAVATIAIHGTGPGVLPIQRELQGLAINLAMAAALLGFLFTAYKDPSHWHWLALTGLVTVASAISFLGYLIPYGQFSFWLAPNGLALPVFPSLLAALALMLLLGLHIYRLHMAGNDGPHNNRYSTAGAIAALLLAIIVATDAYMRWRLPYLLDVAATDQTVSVIANPATLPANPLSVPAHVLPDLKLLPFYAMMRAMPGKTFGVVVLLASMGVWSLLPWLDRGSSGTRPFWMRKRMRGVVAAILACLVVLFGLGAQRASFENVLTAQVITAAYFALLLVGVPWASRTEPARAAGRVE